MVKPKIYTVGHSTRSIQQFIELLAVHGVQTVADVRTVPRSRRVPQFNAEALAKTLPQAGLRYVPFRSLGGWRHAKPDSINTAWRNDSFRGYADFMQTPQFADALAELMKLAQITVTAMMCAEALPWQCHRSLIADALVVRGWQVLDIISQAKATRHQLTKFARVQSTAITYPGEPLFAD